MRKPGVLLHTAALVAFLALLPVCTSVRIQTGPPTAEEAEQSSVKQGKGLRAEWVNRLRDANPLDKATMVKTFMDSVTVRFIHYGSQVAAQWCQGEEDHGREIPASEIRQVIETSTQADQPLLESYDDVIDYGIEQIKGTYHFDQITEELFGELRDHYDGVHSSVFYPNGTCREYESELRELEARTAKLSSRLSTDLRRYI